LSLSFAQVLLLQTFSLPCSLVSSASISARDFSSCWYFVHDLPLHELFLLEQGRPSCYIVATSYPKLHCILASLHPQWVEWVFLFLLLLSENKHFCVRELRHTSQFLLWLDWVISNCGGPGFLFGGSVVGVWSGLLLYKFCWAKTSTIFWLVSCCSCDIL
jgi:hypothetical protein